MSVMSIAHAFMLYAYCMRGCFGPAEVPTTKYKCVMQRNVYEAPLQARVKESLCTDLRTSCAM